MYMRLKENSHTAQLTASSNEGGYLQIFSDILKDNSSILQPGLGCEEERKGVGCI